MTEGKQVNLNSVVSIRKVGMQALNDALGPVGVVRFLQQFEDGSGDYTAEKYERADIFFEDLGIKP